MADSLFDLEEKIALITGSSGGLGKVLAGGLARNGVTVIINGRDRERVETVVELLSNKGYRALPSVFDVTRGDEIEEAAERLNALCGPPDIIINNAGINLRHPLEDFPEEEWDTILNTNLKSAYLVSKAFVQPMIEKREGKIINICSLQSELGRKTIAPYAASKGGLKMLTRAMATEWAHYNIQVNGIGPGYFKTELTRPLYEDAEFDRWLIGRTPAGRWGEPVELIGTLLFLSSEASSYINGQVIYIDGGITAAI
jgi:gluconate 5-dehydrogenase